MLSARQILPGETGHIEIVMNTNGITSNSARNAAVQITTNDPDQQTVTFVIRAIIEPEFALSQRSVYFRNSQDTPKEIVITASPTRDIKVLNARSEDKNVSVSFTVIPGSNRKQVRLTAVQRKGGPPGYHFGQIIVRTSSSLTPYLRIPVRGIRD